MFSFFSYILDCKIPCLFFVFVDGAYI